MSHLYLLAGSNGAGKTTFYERVLFPKVGLPFVNADVIAKAIAGGGPITDAISLEASQVAERQRDEKIAAGESFVAETVFSHESKVELVQRARDAGYTVHLKVIVVPEELTVARVRTRVSSGGHDVPEDRIRGRYGRLWPLVATAIEIADDATVYDNSSASKPYQVIARYQGGRPVAGAPLAPWPNWAPAELRPDP